MGTVTTTNVLSGDSMTAVATTLTTNDVRILGIFWTSDEGIESDIAADDDFLLTDKNANRIIGKRAEAAGAGLEVTIGYPGLFAAGLIYTMDSGYIYVWIA